MSIENKYRGLEYLSSWMSKIILLLLLFYFLLFCINEKFSVKRYI